jgi:DNA-binding MarR family transcriptional regulator
MMSAAAFVMGFLGWLRPRHMIALQLLRDRGPMSQHAVGAALSLDPSNVVGLLNELEERDLIVRRRDPADRRRHIVALSAAGAGELVQSCQKLGEVENGLFTSLTAEERATLYSLLTRATAGLAPDAPCQPSHCTAVAADGR